MGRSPCCDKQLGLKKGPWAPEEDKALVDYIQANGHGSWRSLPKLAGLRRCGKSCRLRWTNYLRPDIKRGPFTQDEQKSIIQLHGIVGNKWSTIAIQLPGRTDNEIKNYWNTHLKKRLLRMGINPETYSPSHTSPLSTPASSSSPTAAATSSSFSAARHMAQWESARLEAEARLSRESLLFSSTLAACITTASASMSPTDQTYLDDQQKKEPADFFLRMWNSDVGDSFRKKTEQSNCQHQVKVGEEESSPGASSSCNTKPSSALTVSEANASQRREEAESEETSDETYQFYLDLAAGDDELSLFNQSSHHHQLESCYSSLFSSDLNELASLDNSFK